MNLLYPTFTARQFGGMFIFGCVGAVIAGAYGMFHDQITFTLGREYFTEFKFHQFHYLEKSPIERVTVLKIGFLATWWVGFFAGWFMGRTCIPHMPLKTAAIESLKGVSVMQVTAIISAYIGYTIAPHTTDDPRMENWISMIVPQSVIDKTAYVQVGYIHNASYLGGLIGLILALLWLKKRRSRMAYA